ncbi:hypothetical protein Tco_1322906 [Tanacetum coccineum]
MSRMDDDLFTYEVEIVWIANIPCDLNKDDGSEQQMSHESDDDMKYNPSNVEFNEWLASKKFNYTTMDDYTKKALWIYWFRGDDEVELTDKESSNSDDEDEVAKNFRIKTNVFDFETPTCRAFKEFNYLLQIDPDVLTKDIEGFKTYEDYKDDWIYEWNKDIPWVHEKPWMDDGEWKEPAQVEQYCEPFNYKNGCSKWPTCSWRDNGYCNGGNLPGAYIVRYSLRYQDFKCNEGWRRWNIYENTNNGREERECENEREHEEERELCDDATRELPVCQIKRYVMIKYSFGDEEKYVAIKEDGYDDLTITSEEACRAY